MKPFHLTIITPEGKFFDKPVFSLTVPATNGRLGVLANHAPMISTLIPGYLTLRIQENSEMFYALNS